ncbi:hypothetical protein ACG3SL_01335 [Sphingomonas sp. CJ20]
MIRKALATISLLVAPVAAHADWYEASSKHFVVYSDDSEDRVKVFTERLERFDQALRKLTGTPDKPLSPNSRVTVFMVADVASVRKLYGNGGGNVAGFYQPRSSGPVAFVPRSSNSDLDAQTILMHEYAHSFMFSTWPDVVFPKWFVEGFAEFVGTTFFRDDGTIVLGKNPDFRKYSVAKSNVLPAERLVQLNTGKLDMYETDALYSRGWLLTHYLLMDKDRAGQLGRYIGALNSGKSVAEATKELGDIQGLDAKLTGYGKRPSLPIIQIPTSQLPIAPVTIRKVSPGMAAIMPARLISTRGVDEKLAVTAVELARRLAAPYPNDPGAQNELAEAEFDAKNYAAAAAAADRALAADPKSVHALIYKGMAESELAKKDETTSVSRWRDIRALFIQANKLDTEYPEPLVKFYDSFEAAKQPPSKGAKDGLLYAYVLAPYDTGLRMQAGRLLLEMGELKQARIAFEPIAYSPHSGPTLSKLGTDLLAKIDAKDGAGALKLLTDAEEKAKKEEEDAKNKKKGG